MDALGEIKAGLVDGFDWNVHPVYFGYAAVLATTLWVIARLLLSVERLSGKEKAPRPPEEGDEGPDEEG